MISDDALLELSTRFQIGEDLAVEKRGEGSWAVTYFGRSVVNRKLEREFEPMPSETSDALQKRTRFSRKEAVEIALRFQQKIAAECGRDVGDFS